MLALRVENNMVIVPVKVVPGASRTRILGLWEGRLRVGVAATPEKGKANAELCAFLAKRLGLRKRDVRVVVGRTSPLKEVALETVGEDKVRALIGEPQ